MNSVTHKLQIPAPDAMASTMVRRGRYIRKHDCRRVIEHSLTVIMDIYGRFLQFWGKNYIAFKNTN